MDKNTTSDKKIFCQYVNLQFAKYVEQECQHWIHWLIFLPPLWKAFDFFDIHLVSSTFNIQFGFLQHFITLKISTFITFQTCALNLIVKTLLSTTFYNFENKCFYNLPNMYLKPHCKNFYEFQWIMANSLTTSLMFFILSKISRL
jgi:hypothetical protein